MSGGGSIKLMGAKLRLAFAPLEGFAKPLRILLASSAYGDSVLDRALLDEHASKIAPARRVGIIVALIVWTLFSIRDILTGYGPAELEIIQFDKIDWLELGLRLIGITSIFVGLILSISSRYRSYFYSEQLNFVVITILYISLLGMVSNQNFAFDFEADLSGLIVFLFSSICLFRLRLRTVMALSLICLPISLIAFYYDTLASMRMAHIHLGPESAGLIVSSDHFLAPSTYLVAAMAIGVAIAGLLERDGLQAILREQKLSLANAELVSARRDAESKTLALVAAKDQLRVLAERESHRKSMFLADAAHDLSQPMHAVSLLVESARHSIFKEDLGRAKVLIEDVTRAVQVARSSFRAVLEASQLQSGLIKATLSGCDIEQLVAENLGPLEVIAKSNGIGLKLRRPKAGPVAVYTDRALFSRLIANLVSNAIKYADPDKGASRAVVVGIVPLSNRVRIDVIDNGIGIPKQHWKTIFEPFVQISNSERNRDKGLGLGLSIVASLLELLPEHRLDMRSVEGQWTRFSLEVPRYRGLDIHSNTIRRNLNADIKLNTLYVFYVEDDESSRLATTALLSDLGILLDVAASMAQAEVAVFESERRPDLVISDFRLPEGKTAVDVARLFRSRWDDEIPVLVLTGDAMPPSPDLIGGAAVVLRKPTSPQDLLNAIQSLCLTALSDGEDDDAEAEDALA